ncbi:MAG: RNA polymerase sigma factor [Planctomycetota bacterium]|jgi:RNA polymerase sigma-70 factor (ECF subfamily)
MDSEPTLSADVVDVTEESEEPGGESESSMSGTLSSGLPDSSQAGQTGGTTNTYKRRLNESNSGSVAQTDWSMIHRAAVGPEPWADDALEQIARRYWPAIYAYIRSTGPDSHAAADLTQGFVCDIILERKLLARATPERGRFRTLLLTALKNYLRDQHRRATRRKRSQDGAKPLQLDHAELAAVAIDDGGSPDDAFVSQWGSTLLRRVIEDVRESCLADGLEVHWAVFEGRIVQPSLYGREPIPYQRLIDEYELSGTSQAANLVITVKRRMVRALVTEVRRTVSEPGQVVEELRELMRELEPS